MLVVIWVEECPTFREMASSARSGSGGAICNWHGASASSPVESLHPRRRVPGLSGTEDRYRSERSGHRVAPVGLTAAVRHLSCTKGRRPSELTDRTHSSAAAKGSDYPKCLPRSLPPPSPPLVRAPETPRSLTHRRNGSAVRSCRPYR